MKRFVQFNVLDGKFEILGSILIDPEEVALIQSIPEKKAVLVEPFEIEVNGKPAMTERISESGYPECTAISVKSGLQFRVAETVTVVTGLLGIFYEPIPEGK